MRERVGLVLAVLMVGASCGDDPGPAPLENASVCSAGWQIWSAEEPFDTSSQLRYKDGFVYFGRYSLRGIVALGAGGAPTLFPTGGFPDQLWVDGDRLLFTSGDLGTQLFAMPIAGGTPELILDGAAGRADAGWGVAAELTESDVFWSEGSLTALGGPTRVWRAARSGGPAVQVGSASAISSAGDDFLFGTLALAPDAILLASTLGVASAVPFDGSPVRSLATTEALTKGDGLYAGIDATGVYWSVPRAGARAEDDAWTLAIAPADGGPVRDFWDGLPAHAAVDGIWPRAGGGWVAVAMQLFDDHRFHATVWEIEANGTGRRLACSPDTSGRQPYVEAAPAVGADAIYLADNGGKFQIIRIPR